MTLNPVGHQSTNWIVRLVLIVATAELTSLGTTSPLHHAQIISNSPTPHIVTNVARRERRTGKEERKPCIFLVEDRI